MLLLCLTTMDGLSCEPVTLASTQDWPRSCSREEWFRITRAIVAGVIADMAENLTDAELSLVEEHFIAAGLL